MRSLIVLCCAVVSSTLAASSAGAQRNLAFSLGGRVAAVQLDGAPAGTPDLRGPSVGFHGELRVVVFTLDGEYQHTILRPGTSAAPYTMLEGQLMGGVRPVRWVELSAGPRIRQHMSPAGTYRTLQWDARLRAQTVLIPRYSRAVITGWRAFAGEVNALASFRAGYGGEAFLELTAPSFLGWLRMGYRWDRTAYGDGRAETLEQMFVTAGFGFGR